MRAAGMGGVQRLMQAPKLPLKLECCSERRPSANVTHFWDSSLAVAPPAPPLPVTRPLVSHCVHSTVVWAAASTDPRRCRRPPRHLHIQGQYRQNSSSSSSTTTVSAGSHGTTTTPTLLAPPCMMPPSLPLPFPLPCRTPCVRLALPTSFVSCPPSIQFALRSGPSTPVRLLLPFSSARPNVRLVAMYRARRPPETAETRSRSCSVLRPVVGPGLPDRQHEAAVIPSPAVLASLPASRKIAMRPSRRCNPYHATHAWIWMSR